MISVISVLVSIVALSSGLPREKSEFVDDYFNAARIKGGSVAPLKAQCYQAALLVGQLVSIYMCGGSIISRRHVLTAAHCIDFINPLSYKKSKPTLYARVGSSKWQSGGSIILFESQVIHPRWDPQLYNYDVGILTVKGEIEFSERVKPLAVNYERVKDGDEALVTGWGRTDLESKASDVLKQLHVKVLSHEKCLQEMKVVASEIMTPLLHPETELCAYHSYGNAVCQGDSGSALLVEDKQVGIVSWGVPCGLGYPDVYARISGLKDFIQPIVGQLDRTT